MKNEEFQNLVLNELKSLRTDVAGLKTDVVSLKEGQSSLQADVAGLKTDVAGLKTDVAGLKTDVAGLKTDVSSLKEGQARIESKLDAVYDQTAILTEFRTEVNMKLDYLVEDNKSIHEILGDHEVSIRTLNRAMKRSG